MKTLILVISSMALFYTVSFGQAQENVGLPAPTRNVADHLKIVSPPPSTVTNASERYKNVVNALNSSANLTQVQYNKVLEVYKNYYSQPESAVSDRGRDAKLKAILTSAQWKKAQEAGLAGRQSDK